MAVDRWLGVFQESLELIKVEMKARHILDEEIAEVIMIHEADKEAKGFFIGHLLTVSLACQMNPEKKKSYI